MNYVAQAKTKDPFYIVSGERKTKHENLLNSHSLHIEVCMRGAPLHCPPHRSRLQWVDAQKTADKTGKFIAEHIDGVERANRQQ